MDTLTNDEIKPKKYKTSKECIDEYRDLQEKRYNFTKRLIKLRDESIIKLTGFCLLYKLKLPKKNVKFREYNINSYSSLVKNYLYKSKKHIPNDILEFAENVDYEYIKIVKELIPDFKLYSSNKEEAGQVKIIFEYIKCSNVCKLFFNDINNNKYRRYRY